MKIKEAKRKKKRAGRYLQMLSRDEMRSLNTLSLSNQAGQLFKEARRDPGGGVGEISSGPVAAAAKQLEWMLIPPRVCTP